MRNIAAVVIRSCDLLEAEGRLMRAGALQLGVALMFVIVATVAAIGGVALAVWGFHQWMSVMLPLPLASLTTALLVLMLAGGALWTARRINR